jgi:hypothetical protein
MGRPRKTSNFKSFESPNEGGRFTRIAIAMMESPAWKSLDVYEQALYLHIKSKFKINQRGESNEKDLSYTYDEGQRLMSAKRFTKSIDRLIETGFIDLIKHRKHTRECNIYGLSDRWQEYGTAAFREKARPK